MAISKLILNGVTQMDVTTDTVDAQYMVSGKTATKADGTKVNGSLVARSSSDLTASGATVTVPAGVYSSQATKSVANGSATTPSTTVTANPSISVSSSGLITATASATKSVTPTVNAGYVSSGTAGTITVDGSNTSQLTTQAAKTVTPTTSNQTAVASGVYTTGAVTVAAMPSGTAGTPTATKGTVSNNSVSVTPSVTNVTGYITGSTKTGTAVTVTASELVSGTKSITENGTGIDVTNYAAVDVSVSGGGSSTYSLTNIVPTQTIATTTSNLYGYVGLIPSYTAYVQSGEWYLVTYDNTEYVVTGYYGANSEILVGDYQLITSNVEWLETPFIVEYNLTNNYFFLGSRVSGNHTLKVDKIDFIDDGVTLVNKTITVNGTYNASSDSADGYSSVTVNVSGGGGSGPTLLTTKSIGTISYSSTTSSDTGQSITVTGYNDYDILIVDVSADSPENGGHVSTVSMAYVTGTSDISTKNTFSAGNEMWHCKLGSTGTASSRKSTTGYGIYAQSVTVSDGTMTIALWQRYSSTYTGTINGSYTARVYGLSLYELIGG